MGKARAKIILAGKNKKRKRIDVSFRVENIVASANLQVELDLFNIAMNVDNVEYEPEQFPGAIMRLKDMGTTLLLFKNGKVICSGAKSEKQIGKSIRRAVELLCKYIS
jgi:transcription initiation factor TFIID TATA-box-binding protein